MASNEEKRFAVGLLATAVLVTLVTLFARFVGDVQSHRDKSAQQSAPSISEDNFEPSQAAQQVSSTPSEQAQRRELTSNARSAAASQTPAPAVSEPESDYGAEPESESPRPVIDPVPLAYFEPDTNSLRLPAVLEKYIDRVDRGTRFMARLEAIVAGEETQQPVEQGELAIHFAARSLSKRLSYNAVHTTEWIEATFESAVSPGTGDVLVDVRRSEGLGEAGGRVALFFASVQEHGDRPGFAIDADVIEAHSSVRVYALTDELPRLGEVSLDPDQIAR